MSDRPALVVSDLRIEVSWGAPIVDGVSFEVERGEILGLVGESGSGKTTASLAMLGFAKPGVHIRAGSVSVCGSELVGRSEAELRRLRGKLVSYVPQDPSTSLNPSLRIYEQVAERLRAHFPDRDVGAEVPRALARTHLPNDRRFLRRFPHQLSGGQQQRVAIAIALLGPPPLVVLDEPTTGLDVVTQARILEEIGRLRRDLGTAMVYVSHDLAVVGGVADRIAVMYGGWVVEKGPTEEILARPRHPYTRGLVASIPDHAVPRKLRGIAGVAVGVGELLQGCRFASRCPQKPARAEREAPPVEAVGPRHTVRCFEWRETPPLQLEPRLVPAELRAGAPLLLVESLRAGYRSGASRVVAADDVSFSVHQGESVALVGESGSGKTTIARCVAGLYIPDGGRVVLDGAPLAWRLRERPATARRRIQIIFQNPYDSLNPRRRIGDQVARPARLLRGLGRRAAHLEALALLERVRLPAKLASRYPRELSGGERQRVAIARALAAGPALLICDEMTSALDVSIQAAVLELLGELQQQLGLALLFISHDLGVVASICDHVLVLYQGTVRERGRAAALLAQPLDDYTRLLIEAAPRLPEVSSVG